MKQLINYYAVLNVDQTATTAQIRTSYRKLALERHPDRNPNDPNSTRDFQFINDAYKTLSDPKKRQSYDLQIRSGHYQLYNPLSTSKDEQKEQKSYTPQFDANNVFGEEFEDLINDELNSQGSNWHFWSTIGGISGVGLGFIIGNVPGAVVGYVSGKYLGSIRDRTGKSVLEVFQNLPLDQRVQILASLAKKIFDSQIGGPK